MTARAARVQRSIPGGFEVLGVETPRIFTQPLRELTEETSLGFAAIRFAENVLRVRLLPWQKWLLIHMLELREDGSFRFRNVVVLVARQNGKTRLSEILSLFFLYVLKVDLVLGTAQDLDVAEDTWREAIDTAEAVPALARRIRKVTQGSGKKVMILTNGARYKVKAANRRAARGATGDLILLDELREHQNWQAWSALTKTTMARDNALVVALSNAGDVTSVVLRHLRKLAHEALGDPDGINAEDDPSRLLLVDEPDLDDETADLLDDLEDDSLGLFEWSAPPGCAKHDRAGWAQANPSLGHLRTFTLRNIISAARTDPEWEFRTEVLCQWSSGGLKSQFPDGAWERSTDAESAMAHDAWPYYAVDVSYDRMMTRISACGEREDGTAHVEVIASRPGTDWVSAWFKDPAHPYRREGWVTGQAKGAPAATVLQDLAELRDDDGRPLLRIVPWQGDELARGCARFWDAIVGIRSEEGDETPDLTGDPRLWHRPAAILDVPAAVAITRKLGDGWVWDRKESPVDISGLVSATAAFWLYSQPDEDEESFYESHRLETV